MNQREEGCHEEQWGGEDTRGAEIFAEQGGILNKGVELRGPDGPCSTGAGLRWDLGDHWGAYWGQGTILEMIKNLEATVASL